jgi:hypothetical protein
MRRKIFTALAVVGALGLLGAATPSASARVFHGFHGVRGPGVGAFGAGLALGTLGGLAWGGPWGYDWGPYGYDYAYAPYDYAYAGPAIGGGDVGWCEAHFRSYNPATETYLGFDGRYHHCG